MATKKTNVRRATEKARRFDSAIRWLRDEARRCAIAAEREKSLREALLLDAAAMSRAAGALDEARD